MSSNKELTEKISLLDPEAETEGLNNVGLAELLASLKTSDDKDETSDDKDETSDDKDETSDDKDETPKPPYTVAEGKALTTKRGVKADGDEIKPTDLPGGKDALEAFVESGHVVKNA